MQYRGAGESTAGFDVRYGVTALVHTEQAGRFARGPNAAVSAFRERADPSVEAGYLPPMNGGGFNTGLFLSDFLGIVQTLQGAHPKRACAVPQDRPDRVVRKALRFGPVLPLPVAEPSHQPSPNKPYPHGTFAILVDKRNIVMLQPGL